MASSLHSRDTENPNETAKTSSGFEEHPPSPLAEPTPRAHHEPGAPDKPLGLVALDSLLRPSKTILRLDLRRAFSLQKSSLSHSHEPQDSPSDTWVRGIHGAQARLQLMQIWDFPNGELKREELPWWFSLGIGASAEMDKGGILVPKARIKTKYAALHVLPQPCLELRNKFPIGISSLAASIRYRIPLSDVENIWNSPMAHLIVNFYSKVGSGFHLTPGGLEFDEHVLKIGKYTTMRVAASVNFPKRIPPDEDEPPCNIDIRRVGLKTRIM
ncbi:hypothetical protein AMTRI_Chr08g208010 [Amborella trichopoda]|uniref:Uncharacterized protein n=1 Tax=Amborella trichopoda TaxID=13333 RepID=W1PLT5_AMBTC|nr:uncharacterized protein LOC18437152 [Amborella trichopoda]ERN09013.1 hypothetical protein AMTR_s00153p00081120 [Amborella trichopoda]|eukprot:XP_006847432.1 uncharacterized protein LOC18437152 [Amborella trichopoda]